MKIVVVKAPKALKPFLRAVFHIKKETGKVWYLPRVDSMVLNIDVEGGEILSAARRIA